MGAVQPPAAALLAAVDPWLPAALVPPAARRWIGALSAELPDAWSVRLFECRLAAGDERVDYQLCAMDRDGGRAALAAALDGGAWPRLGSSGALARKWAQADGGPLAQVPCIWLEADCVPDRAVDPFLYATLDPGYLDYLHPQRPSPAPPSARAVRDLAEAWLADVPGHTLDARQLERLQWCTRALPRTGRMFTLAATPQRGTADLRVVAALPQPEIGAWLAQVEWPGDQARLAWMLERFGPAAHDRSVYLDIGARVQPSLAIDFGPEWDRLQWQWFLDGLVAEGLADAEKARAAYGWIGRARLELDGGDWPVDVRRHLSVKLVSRANGALEVKAYLMLGTNFRLL